MINLAGMKRFVLISLCLLVLHSPAHGANKHSRSSASTTFLIADSWITGFTYGFCNSKEKRLKNAWKRANRTAGNDAKIWAGLFVSNPHRNTAGRIWETVSRLTWQLPQTVVGLGYAHFENTIGGNVDTVRYYYGTTVTTGRHSLFFRLGGPAVTLSNYIVGHNGLHANVNNYYFQHEYGHYLQSQSTGIAYFGAIAIPNILSEHGEYEKLYSGHDFHPTEQDANRRAFLYFNEHTPGFQHDSLLTAQNNADNLGWDFRKNPLLNAGVRVPYKGWRIDSLNYVDYSDPAQVTSLEKLRVRAKWYDYVLPAISGFYNSYRYNHLKRTKKQEAAAPGKDAVE